MVQLKLLFDLKNQKHLRYQNGSAKKGVKKIQEGHQQLTSCFTNQVFYVRNTPLCNYTINKITVIITAITIIFIITIIIIIVIIFNFKIPIIIIITIIIKSTIVIIIILSLFLYFFNIKSLCVIFVFEFISVFLTTCFLLFTGFRCIV